jgi:hypothetical protein
MDERYPPRVSPAFRRQLSGVGRGPDDDDPRRPGDSASEGRGLEVRRKIELPDSSDEREVYSALWRSAGEWIQRTALDRLVSPQRDLGAVLEALKRGGWADSDRHGQKWRAVREPHGRG